MGPLAKILWITRGAFRCQTMLTSSRSPILALRGSSTPRDANSLIVVPLRLDQDAGFMVRSNAVAPRIDPW